MKNCSEAMSISLIYEAEYEISRYGPGIQNEKNMVFSKIENEV